MKENSRTWLLVAGVAALLAFAALIYVLFPGILSRAGLDGDDLGGGVLAALILWLVLHKKPPMTRRMRVVLSAAVALGLLLGLAVYALS